MSRRHEPLPSRPRPGVSGPAMSGPAVGGAVERRPPDIGAIESRPDILLGQLAEGGRLVAFLQDTAQGRATLFVKEHGQIGDRPDFDATVPLLAGFKKKVGFIF